MRRARILDWVRMRRSHDRYNHVEPSSPPQSSPDYTIVIRGYNFREGQVTFRGASHLTVAPITAVRVPPPCWVNRGLITSFCGRSENRFSVLRCAQTSASPGLSDATSVSLTLSSALMAL